MSTPLGEWKDTLEDLGVIGLVPDPVPTRDILQPTPNQSLSRLPQNSAPQTAIVGSRTSRMPSPKQPAAKETTPWQAPTDAKCNPSVDAIEACQTLDALNECICHCEACPLGANRIKFVFGEGSPTAQMMFIGEGPGSEEDIMGRPFVGRAGDLLNKMISALSMARSDVFIANIVKCRPPDNRVPTAIEAKACLRYLMRQIELVRPAVIVGLGATPLRELIGIPSGITKIRGTWHKINVADREIPYMPTFHPAYILRSYTEAVRRAAWDDLKAAKLRAEQDADN